MDRPSQRRREPIVNPAVVLPPGQIIPGTRYRILSRLGAGAMGVVYAAEHVDLEKRVALKTLHGRAALEPLAVDQFRQEARAASKIGSPYICDVTDFGTLPDGQAFYVMEYLAGSSLRQILEEEGALSPERAVAILRQVCKALGAAHEKGIIHLDVKPDNVMVTRNKRRNDNVKIVDFGIAGLMNAEAARGGSSPEETVVGTPDYLAPERVRGLGYDHRSDVYSLGATAYEMLTGTCLFPEEEVMTTLTKHAIERPTPMRARVPLRKVPRELEAVVMQMLEKSPEARPQSMVAVEAMLCDAQIAAKLETEWDDLELPAVDEAWQKKLRAGMPSPAAKRWQRRVLAISLVALAAIGLSVFMMLRRAHRIVEYKPVFVEVTKTDEAEAVAPWLRRAANAAESERFFEPTSASALHFIEQAETEAAQRGITSPGAAGLRRLYGNQFKSLGNALQRAGLGDLALVRYRQALRFLPRDGEVRTELSLLDYNRTSTPERPGSSSPRPANDESRRPDSEAQTIAANLFAAVSAGRFSQGQLLVTRLRAVDSDGQQAARLADEFRASASVLWDQGKRAEARLRYAIVMGLDPKDPVARERAASSEEAKVVAAPPVEEPPTAAASRRRIVEDRAGDGPRDRVASNTVAEQGQAALSRGDLARAEDAFARAIRLDSSNPEAMAGLAEVAFERARYTEALDYGRRAVRAEPKTGRFHVVVGDAYFKLLRYDEALTEYRKAQTLSPRDQGINARVERVRAKLGAEGSR